MSQIPLSRRGRSSARRLERSLTTCRACREGRCEKCVDVLRSTYTNDRLCTCGRDQHEAALPDTPAPYRLPSTRQNGTEP